MKKFILVICLLFAVTVQAHTSGFTFEEVKGDYFVDIGANKKEIIPGELTLFEYNLFPRSDANNLADFDSVYVTISDQAHGVIYAGSVHRPEGGLTVMSYSFPDGGEYEMSARFDKDNNVLAESVFKIPVTVKFDSSNILKLAGLGLAAVLLIAYWVAGSKKLEK